MYGGFDVRIWRLTYMPRGVTMDLYKVYQGEPERRVDGAWIWRLRVHLRD